MPFDEHIPRLVDAIDPVMSAWAFKRDGEREWVRQWGWKQDLVDLHMLLRGVLVNLYVLIPHAGAADEYEALAVEGLGHVLGRERPELAFPLFGVAGHVGSAVERAMAWYDRFDTPSKCLDYMRSGGKKSGTGAYASIEASLIELPSELDLPACLVRWPFAATDDPRAP